MHRAALGIGALSDEWAARRLPVHVGRPGFAFLVAREGSAIAGFGYGYTGVRGEWWSEGVAAALSTRQRAEWVDAPHFEVVELHVLPDCQRSGLGTAILAALLHVQPHARALLTTRSGSEQARRFYAKNGWVELAPVDFGAGFPPYLVLGRKL